MEDTSRHAERKTRSKWGVPHTDLGDPPDTEDPPASLIDDQVGAEAMETILHRLYDASRSAPFDIKVTAAPHYNRVVLERKRAEKRAGLRLEASDVLTDGAAHSRRDGIGRGRNVNDGDGFLFVGRTGEIHPSGFLPVSVGNVRTDDLVAVYRDHALLRRLRNRDLLVGKCRACEYRTVCGGSRSRAWAMTGNPFESDPLCPYVPPGWQSATATERG